MTENEVQRRELAELIWPLADYHVFACHADSHVRCWALRRATLFQPELVQSTLVQALRDPSPRVVLTAPEQLRGIDPLPLDAVQELLGRTEPGDARRWSALDLLAEGGDAEAKAQLDQELVARREAWGAPPETEALVPPPGGEEGEGYQGEELRRAVTEEEARSLRPRALGRLGRTDCEENIELLLALGLCRWRWASSLLGERFEELLASEADEAAWHCVSELGDPSRLDGVLRAWRPGEPTIAETAVFLARLGGRLGDLPPDLRQEASSLSWPPRPGPASMRSRTGSCLRRPCSGLVLAVRQRLPAAVPEG